MSAAGAEPIRTPDRLNLPEGLRDLAAGLSPDDRARLVSELLEALEAARSSGDLTTVQSTIHRWHRIATRVGDIRQELAGHLAELEPEACRLRDALRRGESPSSLGLVEGGLDRIMAERGISV